VTAIIAGHNGMSLSIKGQQRVISTGSAGMSGRDAV
jgi:hypothetical protein